MAGLAVALAERGCRSTYVAQRRTSTVGDRASQGWGDFDMGSVEFRLAETQAEVERLVESAASDSIHVCESIRGKGSSGHAQAAVGRRGLRQWAVMERVKDQGLLGPLKRLAYRARVIGARGRVEGVLAIGRGVPEWIVARGFPADRVFPFTYFLGAAKGVTPTDPDSARGFRVAFAGRLVELKRVDLLIEAIARLGRPEVELEVIGTGPMEPILRELAARLLPERVRWLGRMPFDRVPAQLRHADCLVLPSRIDGWGAVVSEALMQGTPAVCSSECGASVAVEASGTGGVFASGSVDSLAAVLERQAAKGKVAPEERTRLASWASCLGAEAGATYLLDILAHAEGHAPRPAAPWSASTAPDAR